MASSFAASPPIPGASLIEQPNGAARKHCASARGGPTRHYASRKWGAFLELSSRPSFLETSHERGSQALPPRAAAEAVPGIADVTIDNCTVLVVGQNSLGLEIFRRFAKAGSWVTALHDDEAYRREIEGLGAMLAVGEATSADKVAKVLKGNTFDAVIYAVGSDASDALASPSTQLTVLMAARAANVPRFLLVSSSGAEDGESLSSVVANLEEGGPMLWTVVRTGPLSEQSSGPLALSDNEQAPAGATTAADVAALVSQVLFDADFSQKVLTAVTEDNQ